jgi:outer membrane immunogenic protein
VVTYFSWTGCYVGGNVGGVWVNKKWFDAFNPGVVGQSYGSHEAKSWIGGVQAGCNYQAGSWIFGSQGL